MFRGENAIASSWGYNDSSSGGLVYGCWVKCDGRFADIRSAGDPIIVAIFDLFCTHFLVFFAGDLAGPEWQGEKLGVSTPKWEGEKDWEEFHKAIFGIRIVLGEYYEEIIGFSPQPFLISIIFRR